MVLKGVNFAQSPIFLLNGLERSHFLLEIFSWALSMSMCESSVNVAGSDKSGFRLVSFPALGEESPELGSTEDSFNGNDAGGEYEGDLGE